MFDSGSSLQCHKTSNRINLSGCFVGFMSGNCSIVSTPLLPTSTSLQLAVKWDTLWVNLLKYVNFLHTIHSSLELTFNGVVTVKLLFHKGSQTSFPDSDERLRLLIYLCIKSHNKNEKNLKITEYLVSERLVKRGLTLQTYTQKIVKSETKNITLLLSIPKLSRD